jgi:phosphoribosylamine--glycine ligase
MRVLVVGSGGREHALVWKILQSKRVTRVYCEPGNGGTAKETGCPQHGISRIEDLADFARHEGIALTIVGQELPLTQGIVDYFEKQKLPIIGPNLAAARLEGSKLFAKQFMQRHQIPTSPYLETGSAAEARSAVDDGRFGFPLVIKADGLAAGKGVVIANEAQEAHLAIRQMLEDKVLGSAGNRVVIEKYLRGEEISFLVFTDGVHILPMVPSQDHKRVFDGDCGPNTGGMGAYSTDSLVSPELCNLIMDRIVHPTVLGMAVEGNPYSGILYFGLMLTEEGPQVLEFNARMGDPETQPVLLRLRSDIVDVFEGILEKKLDRVHVQWSTGCGICVVLASGGYPHDFEKGKPISGICKAESLSGVKVFHAGTRLNDGDFVTSGGRVLGVTAHAENLRSAIDLVYRAVELIHFDNVHYRKDIGMKGLNRDAIGSSQ